MKADIKKTLQASLVLIAGVFLTATVAVITYSIGMTAVFILGFSGGDGYYLILVFSILYILLIYIPTYIIYKITKRKVYVYFYIIFHITLYLYMSLLNEGYKNFISPKLLWDGYFYYGGHIYTLIGVMSIFLLFVTSKK